MKINRNTKSPHLDLNTRGQNKKIKRETGQKRDKLNWLRNCKTQIKTIKELSIQFKSSITNKEIHIEIQSLTRLNSSEIATQGYKVYHSTH